MSHFQQEVATSYLGSYSDKIDLYDDRLFGFLHLPTNDVSLLSLYLSMLQLQFHFILLSDANHSYVLYT